MTRLEIKLIVGITLPLVIAALVLAEVATRAKGLGEGWRVALSCLFSGFAGAIGAEINNKLRARWER